MVAGGCDSPSSREGVTMAKRSKFRAGEQTRFRALAYKTQEAMTVAAVSGSLETPEAATGEALWAGLRSAVKATVPGLQSDAQVDAYTDLATAAFLRTMRRRIDRPNPRGL